MCISLVKMLSCFDRRRVTFPILLFSNTTKPLLFTRYSVVRTDRSLLFLWSILLQGISTSFGILLEGVVNCCADRATSCPDEYRTSASVTILQIFIFISACAFGGSFFTISAMLAKNSSVLLLLSDWYVCSWSISRYFVSFDFFTGIDVIGAGVELAMIMGLAMVPASRIAFALLFNRLQVLGTFCRIE